MPTLPRQPQRQTVGRLRYRKSIERLTARQLAHVRQAFAAVAPIDDERGYQHHAGIHGVPLPSYCQHGRPGQGAPLFLPWHRAYLYFFELALQERQPGVSMPWWDWTSPGSHRDGIPAGFADARVRGQANPLASAEIQPRLRGRDRSWPRRTSRDTAPAAELPTAAQVERVLSLGDYYDFSSQLEDIHGQIHGWAGGTMGLIAFAAYDPIFWAHHAMVDRLWRLWQIRHPGSRPDSRELDRALPPFAMTVRETLDVNRLGYDYAVATTHVDARP